MQLTIDIPEDDIKKALQSMASTQVAGLVSTWRVQQDVTNRVKQLWDDMMDEQILNVLANSEKMRATIEEAVAKKLQSQVNIKMRQLEALRKDETPGILT